MELDAKNSAQRNELLLIRNTVGAGIILSTFHSGIDLAKNRIIYMQSVR